MGQISFLLNGETITVDNPAPTLTLLDWLRNDRAMTGTKEGCNEGDCGACSVMVSSLQDGKLQHKALNACILFMPQLQGKSLRTVEGLHGPEGQLHPVQQAMVDLHGSQCGFCTPGFIMSMTAAHQSGDTNHNDVLAGNLCRCTGYAPIIRAAEAASNIPVPGWMDDETATLAALNQPEGIALQGAFVPESSDELADWYLKYPEATLVGGATDVALWVNKSLRDIEPVGFISQITELQDITYSAEGMTVGAAVTLTALGKAIAPLHPDFAEMIRRYGSTQVRNAATIGGNIANGSPIGDGPPALIALGARLRLRKGNKRREILLEDFFIAYGQQDREPGEFVESIFIPAQRDDLKCYKLSKRFDQDISAVCGCFNLRISDGVVTKATIAFGGMAATPKRANTVEEALIGQLWNEATIQNAMAGFDTDYTPMSDMRASAQYRQITAKNMLMRYFRETELPVRQTRVLEQTA